MDTCCTPLVIDLFLLCHEGVFMLSLFDNYNCCKVIDTINFVKLFF